MNTENSNSTDSEDFQVDQWKGESLITTPFTNEDDALKYFNELKENAQTGDYIKLYVKDDYSYEEWTLLISHDLRPEIKENP